jgi:hypothetical protein
MASQKISGLFGNFSGALSNDDDFGTSATSLGDLDGAGPSVQAIVVGAIGDDDGGSDRGCVWVMFLNGTPTANVPWTPIESTVALGLARPNPFRAGTSMMFRLPEAAHVRIDVVDLQGRIVRELRNESAAAGEHETMWDGRDDARRALAPGAYLLRLSVNGRVTASRKAVLLN